MLGSLAPHSCDHSAGVEGEGSLPDAADPYDTIGGVLTMQKMRNRRFVEGLLLAGPQMHLQFSHFPTLDDVHPFKYNTDKSEL